MASTVARRPVRIELSGVTKRFSTPSGSMFTALRSIDLAVGAGKFCAVVGPTGCGKSTTLTMVAAGLAQHGHRIGGRPGRRRDYRGHRFHVPGRRADAVENRPRQRGPRTGIPWRAEKRSTVPGARLGAPGRLGRLRGSSPAPVVRGDAQARGLAAALINEPSILLMDEPFGALDVQTKAIMSNELLGLWEQTRPSVIFVTHDLEEAIALADQVVVMTAGPGTVKAVLRHRPGPAARRGTGDPLRFPLRRKAASPIWASLREEVRGRVRPHGRGGRS